MEVIKKVNEWCVLRETLSSERGLVPTMGNLHEGHLSLIQRCVNENPQTVVSLFVNPAQFNNADDFNHYPQTIERDLELLEEANVDYCLIPDKRDMYPDDYVYQVSEKEKSLVLEGKHRPGHFDGVLTVLLKLFMLVQPRNTYFGEKDYQQYTLVKGMVDAFFMDVNVIACKTKREPSMLALSSRNNRLSVEQKRTAERFAAIFHQGPDVQTIKAELEKEKITIDYIEDYQTRRYGAVYIDKVRLIDNYNMEHTDNDSISEHS